MRAATSIAFLQVVPAGSLSTARRKFLFIIQVTRMKYLEYTPLARIDAFLCTLNLGDSLLKGNLQAYSCKAAGVDKKYFRSLEQEVIDSLLSSPSEFSVSPLGPLSRIASRRTFIYLILAMSHVYPDYDFSLLCPTSFEKEDLYEASKLTIENHLIEASKVWACNLGEHTPLVNCIWQAIDEVIGLEDCDVYSYNPEAEGDPLTERGTIWSFSYFFYNRKLRRMVCFSCQCLSKLAVDEDSLHEMLSEEEGDYLLDLDIDMD